MNLNVYSWQGRLLVVELGSALDVDEWIGQVAHVGTDVFVLRPDVGPDLLVSTEAVGSVRVPAGPMMPRAVSTGYPDTLDARLRAATQDRALVRVGRRFHSVLEGEAVGLTPTHLEIENTRQERGLVPKTQLCWLQFP